MQYRTRWSLISRLLLLFPLLALPLFSLQNAPQTAAAAQAYVPDGPGISRPIIEEEVKPYDFSGSLLDLADEAAAYQPQHTGPRPLKYTPGTRPKGSAPQLDRWHDPIVQNTTGATTMPTPSNSFEGMSFTTSGGYGWPPDTNGDVDANYYIQTVNTSIGIFSKATGLPVSIVPFDVFFTGTGTPCDYSNTGDPVVVYDRFVSRWIITDFSVDDPYYECLAVSKTSDPVSGGWWMYALKVSSTELNDYPKLGVWNDSYIMTFNMFSEPNWDWAGVQVWAFQKSRMINGQSLRSVHFTLSAESGYQSLLPAHALTAPDPAAANYLMSTALPGQLQIWKFKPDWNNTLLSSFTGPTIIPISDYAIADSIPQPISPALLDSLSFRPMMQLIYRRVNGVDALWMSHTVSNQGIAAVRWYEVRNPAGTPALYQEGTYQPDSYNRWMPALAVDQDGNMGIGYSIASETLFPGIRYTGRLSGEMLGQLPQGENVLVNGTGAQLQYTRWGDYSSMSIDPVDECTFWYTTEYYSVTSTNWQTRIGSFKFPSCGQPKGKIRGVVRNSVTLAPVPNAPVKAVSSNQTMTVLTDVNGVYTITLASDTFTVTAGPLQPGYPTSSSVINVPLSAPSTTTQDMLLNPVPNLVEHSQAITDNLPTGNNNGFPEPGESNLDLSNLLRNTGAITSTNIIARLDSLTAGVTITQKTAGYPNIAAGANAANTSPFTFAVDKNLACGSSLDFRKVITDSVRTYTETFSLTAGIVLNRVNIFSNNVENGAAGWTTGGTNNTWDITTAEAKSATHSWTDSPAGAYANDTDSWLMTPVYDLTNIKQVKISFWTRYFLEPGYDYVYLEYSTNGGGTWTGMANSLVILNGDEATWKNISVSAPMLDNQPNVRLRFRLVADSGVTEDGIYIDDFNLSYQPYACIYGIQPSAWLPIVTK